MNDALKMQISAFVDGELPDNEAEFLLRRLSQDAGMRQQVAQYLEIGRMARRDRDIPGMDGLRGRINEALGEEPLVVEGKPEVVGSKLMTPASGIAVAAAVAVVALIGLSQLSTPDVPVVPIADLPVAIDTGGSYTEPTPDQVLANQPTERLLEYRRRHDDTSYSLGSNDIISRMVTFELREGELVEIEPDPHFVEPQTDDDGAFE
ncbi:MAG: RseA family anti-sigma factor [Woeseiaceae bacterium]|jgi:negative regulator of sigma E activity|nr:RseA family anti-sigma factor [Woeseiaceae bacterium]